MVSALTNRDTRVIEERNDVDVARAAGDLLEWTRAAQPSRLPDVVSAVGRLGVPALARQIASLAEHPCAEVRVVVAQVLGELPDDSPATIAALVLLSCDRDEEVRSWATFALAGDRFSEAPGVVDALIAKLGDSSEEVRVEATRGLARRSSLQ
jgi:HEAT repeat protein